jgi:stress response protein SCP2
MFETIVSRTHRIPLDCETLEPGRSSALARQMDAALLKVAGFKLSVEALERLSACSPDTVKGIAEKLRSVVEKKVGGHVRHNPYFKAFPRNVPSTVEFWWRCVVDALGDARARERVKEGLAQGTVNLLDLPRYGRVTHTYEEMVAAHIDLMPSLVARVTVLEVGGTLAEETRRFYEQLASSVVPLSEEDRAILRQLATASAEEPPPANIPIRETRAFIGAARIEAGHSFTADTVTDVLRVAAALTPGGDATLEKPTRFRSFPRGQRRLLMKVLEEVVSAAPTKLADVHRHTEAWKRLGEKLHANEFPQAQARRVFAVARGEEKIPTLASRVERAFSEGNLTLAQAILSSAPGMFARQMDRLILAAQHRPATLSGNLFVETLRMTFPRISGRVLLSLREHLMNRSALRIPLADAAGNVRVTEEALREHSFSQSSKRVFFNRKGKAWVTDETRAALDSETVAGVIEEIDREIDRRLPSLVNLEIDPAVLGVAVPLTEKIKSRGFGVLPRGSLVTIPSNKRIRFFMYWLQRHERTDYDLSVQVLNGDFESIDHCSFRTLRGYSGLNLTHSGDVTDAPSGATEFIDATLDSAGADARYVVPQVNVFSGESFDTVTESFFGVMERDDLSGRPFEPRTVKVKSDLTGKGQVALPLVFIRDDDGTWHAKWLHLYLKGEPRFNTLEGNRLEIGLLLRGIVERRSLTLGYLISRLARKARTVEGEPPTYIGLEPRAHCSYAAMYTPLNFAELIPA